MTDMSYVAPKGWDIPLSAKFLNLDDDERTFFKITTGINDDEELRRHIIEAQAKAFAVRHVL